MRGLAATLTLLIAICGMLVVVAYAASEAYFELRNDEADLHRELLLGSVAPNLWSATELSGVDYGELFVTPCLGTPLLDRVGISGRGATNFVPGSGGLVSSTFVVIQTSPASARSIMDDVRRDTENNCQRGVTVGTIERAVVTAPDIAGADDVILVQSDRDVRGELREVTTGFIHSGELVGRISIDTTDASASTISAFAELTDELATQLVDPPGEAELEAAGAVREPTQVEVVATRVNDTSADILSGSGRYPVEAGLGVFGAIVLVLFLLGARLNRAPQFVAAPRPSTMENQATLSDYGSGKAASPVESSGFDLRANKNGSEDEEPDPGADLEEDTGEFELPPVLDFPQRSIEEKLAILKEARLKDPPREHRPVREAQPDVSWTDEISKASTRPASEDQPTGATAQEPVTRKALLKKLKSDSS